MRPCEKCLENSWHLQLIEDWVRATCELCGHEIEFEKRNAGKKKIVSDNDSCRKCGGELFWKSAKLNSKRQKKAYHYCKWLKCKKCCTVYMSDEFKILKGEACSCQKTVMAVKQQRWFERGEESSTPPSNYLIDV